MTAFDDDATRLHVTVHTDGDRITLTLTGELDLFSGRPLAQLLDEAMDGSVKYLDVQMALVDFVDVDGVRVLVHAYRLGASRGVTLTLHDPQPDIVWLLHITGAALLLGGITAPVRAGEPVRVDPSVPSAGNTGERDRRADERDRRADDRDRLAEERDRLVDERQRRVSEHQRWEDIREDVADARERNLERRENER